MNITVFTGDIADAPADAVCTSTNPRLSLMMGTGASIRERGGFEVLRACETIVSAAPVPFLAPGSAHITTAGRLPFAAAIHVVACNAAHLSSEAIVRACVVNALRAADTLHVRSLAMPVFASGHARVKYPRAVSAMLDALFDTPTQVEHVVIVTLDDEHAAVVRSDMLSRNRECA